MTDILYQVADGIGQITINRPDSRNALKRAMYTEIARLCREIPGDGSVRVLILRGAGDRAFAAGTDMTEFRGFSEPQDALDYEEQMDQVLRDIEQCKVPTIAAITGACTGGGAAISAACDIRLCDTRLKWGFPIARTLGNCLSIGNLSRLSALVGQGRLREILFTARLIEADEALQVGLVAEVLDSAEAVHARARALAGTLTAHAPLTMRATKEAMRRLRTQGPDADDSDLVTLCYMSQDFKMGMEAFLAKQKPDWQGK
ncbi:MAG: enoyl-CoA hydratase/isomerase family protein [Pseudomonadota bacterium]